MLGVVYLYRDGRRLSARAVLCCLLLSVLGVLGAHLCWLASFRACFFSSLVCFFCWPASFVYTLCLPLFCLPLCGLLVLLSLTLSHSLSQSLTLYLSLSISLLVSLYLSISLYLSSSLSQSISISLSLTHSLCTLCWLSCHSSYPQPAAHTGSTPHPSVILPLVSVTLLLKTLISPYISLVWGMGLR